MKKSHNHANLEQTLNTVKKKLHSRVQKANSDKIVIREIIAHHELAKYGEFNLQNPIEESRDSTLNRMVSFVNEIAHKFIPMHLEDNYEAETLSPKSEVDAQSEGGKPKYGVMKTTHVNHITRLTFNEFSLYPHQSSGPLTQDEFEAFLIQLDALAQSYPDNFHLMIGTIPVLFVGNKVRNMGIYLQCGQSSSINVFSKTIPYNTDPTYPNTVNVDFSADSPTMWLNEMNAHVNKIIDQVNTKYEKFAKNLQMAHTPGYKKGLNDLVNATSMYLESLNELISRDKQGKSVKVLTAKILSLQQSLKSMLHANADIAKLWQENIKLLQAMTDEYSRFEQAHILARDAQLNKIPNALLPDHSNTVEAATFYTGSFAITTVGGAKFHMVAEICFDHALGVHRHKMHRDINHSKSKGEFTYHKKASHIIVSNSVGLTQNNVICESLTHADPTQSSLKHANAVVKPLHKEVIESPKFGTKLTVIVYPPMELLSHIEPIRQMIDVYHEFQLELECWQIMRAQQPRNIEAINQEIVLLMIEKMLPYFDKVSETFRARFMNIEPNYFELMSLLNIILNELIDDDTISLDAPQFKECLRVIRAAQSIIQWQVEKTYELEQAFKKPSPVTRQYIGQNNARPQYHSEPVMHASHTTVAPVSFESETFHTENATPSSAAVDCHMQVWPLNDEQSLTSASCNDGTHTLHVFQKGEEGDVSSQTPMPSQGKPTATQCQPIQFFGRPYLRCETESLTLLASSEKVDAKQNSMNDFANAGAVGLLAVEAKLMQKSIQWIGSLFAKTAPLSADAQQQAIKKIDLLAQRLYVLEHALTSVGGELTEESKQFYCFDIKFYHEQLREAQQQVKHDPKILATLQHVSQWIDEMEDLLRSDLANVYK